MFDYIIINASMLNKYGTTDSRIMEYSEESLPYEKAMVIKGPDYLGYVQERYITRLPSTGINGLSQELGFGMILAQDIFFPEYTTIIIKDEDIDIDNLKCFILNEQISMIKEIKNVFDNIKKIRIKDKSKSNIKFIPKDYYENPENAPIKKSSKNFDNIDIDTIHASCQLITVPYTKYPSITISLYNSNYDVNFYNCEGYKRNNFEVISQKGEYNITIESETKKLDLKYNYKTVSPDSTENIPVAEIKTVEKDSIIIYMDITFYLDFRKYSKIKDIQIEANNIVEKFANVEWENIE